MQQATSEPVHAPPTRGVGHPAEALSDPDALAATIRITGGNLRLVQRLFAQINRIAEINDLDTVTRDVVDTARESLIIGAAYGPWAVPGPVAAAGRPRLGPRNVSQAVSPPRAARGRRARRNPGDTDEQFSDNELSNRAI